MSVYQGEKSCYARKEGIYVRKARKPGIDTLGEAAAISYLILRDLKRGYTYENKTCRKIKMTEKTAIRRLVFLKFLARRHKAPKDIIHAVDYLVEYVIKHQKLPSGKVVKLAKKMIAS